MHIYKIVNTTNNKVYIGQTRPTYALGRWSAHKNKLNNGTHKNPHLLAAWRKYGPDSWIFEIIDTAETIKELDEKETKYIHQFDSTNPTKGYNVASGGTDGFVLSVEARKKISKAGVGRIKSSETKEKLRLSMLGKKMPPKMLEQIEHQRSSLIKKWADPEFKARMCKIRQTQMTDEVKTRIIATKKQQYKLYGANQAKDWPPLKSPDGMVYEGIHDMTKFAKEHNLNAGILREVCRGNKNQYRGWTKAP